MPNGNGEVYNAAWCRKTHERVDENIDRIWDKFRTQDRLMWGVMLALIGNLGGVAATLVILAVQNGAT